MQNTLFLLIALVRSRCTMCDEGYQGGVRSNGVHVLCMEHAGSHNRERCASARLTATKPTNKVELAVVVQVVLCKDLRIDGVVLRPWVSGVDMRLHAANEPPSPWCQPCHQEAFHLRSSSRYYSWSATLVSFPPVKCNRNCPCRTGRRKLHDQPTHKRQSKDNPTEPTNKHHWPNKTSDEQVSFSSRVPLTMADTPTMNSLKFTWPSPEWSKSVNSRDRIC